MSAVMVAEAPEPFEGQTDMQVRLHVYDLLGEHRSSLSPIEHGTLSMVVASRSPERIARFVADIKGRRGRRDSEQCEVCGRPSNTRWCPACQLADFEQTREFN